MTAWGTRRLAIAIAKTQVGYHEHGNNRNKYSTAMGRSPEAWCADFVSWVLAKAKVPPYTPNSASSLRLLQQAQRHGGDHGAKAGAIVRYTISHVGLVIDGHHHTVEGNTSATHNLSAAAQRSGGAVAAKSTTRLRVDGYGMPDYAHDDGSALWRIFPYVRLLSVDGQVGRYKGFQTGPDVRRVQHLVGATDAHGHTDGQYGKHTAELVKKWQKDHGLKPSGHVGSKTWKAMFDD